MLIKALDCDHCTTSDFQLVSRSSFFLLVSRPVCKSLGVGTCLKFLL